MTQNSSHSDHRLLRVREAAREFHVNPRRLWRAIREGDLTGFQIDSWLRVRPGDVLRWVEKLRYVPGKDSDR